jgi:hypothetical protein
MKNLALVFFVLVCNNLIAQIDTTDWYPLHIGDKWEYYGQGFGYSQVEVIGDTLMPNGKTYYIFSDGVDAWRFQRKEGDSLVYYYSTAGQKEYLLFDFKTKDKTLWKVDFEHYWGIFEINIDNQNLLNAELPYRIFEGAIIDSTINPPDTVWGYLIDAYPTRITKNFGITSYTYDLTYLVGAVINGVGYGTLVNIKEDKNIKIPNTFNLFQNYPNPFNPETTISYNLPQNSFVKLKIYDNLGSEIAVLVNEEKPAGYHTVKFDASKLSSGIYYYRLQSGEFVSTRKMILSK